MHVARNSNYQFFESEKPLFTCKFIFVAIAAVMDQEIDHEERGPFVAVDETVISDERFYEGRRLAMDGAVVAGIRPADR